jgi:hypothetical protein
MAEHPNVARVTRALQARARGKFDDEDTRIILDAFADDAVWHMSGAWDDVKGKDALLAQWKAVAEAGATASGSSSTRCSPTTTTRSGSRPSVRTTATAPWR